MDTTTTRQTAGANPGWYQQDPATPVWRWWDGQQWTEHQTVERQPPELAEAVGHLARIRKDVRFMAMVLKVLVVLWLLGIVFWVLVVVAGVASLNT